MAQMTGGQAVVQSLVRHGVDTVFGVPGVQMDHLFNALYEERNRVRVINTRHEQGAGYMAFGYAASTGRVGTFAVVPGPGLLNTTAALSTGYACNTPMLCLAGQIPAPAIGRGFGLLHELPDQLALVRGLTKHAERALHPSAIPGLMRRAFQELVSGRVRPVECEVPMDVLGRQAEVGPGDPAPPIPPPPVDWEQAEQAARALGRARRPLIFVGGGIWGAEEPLAALAEMLQAPVIMSRNALGALSARHYLAQTYTAGHRLWADADVVLGVGTRLNPMVPGWGLRGLKVLRLDIDPAEVARAASPDVALVADAREGLEVLVKLAGRHNRRRAPREEELRSLHDSIQAELGEKLAPQMAYLKVMREVLPEEGIFVEELTQPGYVARLGFPVYRPRSYISTGYQGTLGFGFAAALGVKVAHPERPVLSISGDGGFMYNVQELSTAVQHGLDVVVVVFNDGAFGNVKRMQLEDHGGKVIATDLHNPDFVKLAESFGARGRRAHSLAELRAALEQGFASPGPTLIDVPMGETPGPWGYLNPPAAR